MTDNRRRSLLGRIRDKLAAPGPALAAEPVAEPEPPRRTHLFASQYRVHMSFEELMTARGYIGQAALYRNRLVPATDAHRQSDAELRRGGSTLGEVLWPSD
jgi:phage terminase small subunit